YTTLFRFHEKTVLKVTLCLAISVLFTACSKDDDNGDAIVPDGRISFDVSIEGSDQDEAASLEADATYEIHHNTNGVRWVAINGLDRKSTRLNSSHVKISYAVFCLKKKKKRTYEHPQQR